jgi:hypothetical protein
MMKKHIFVNDNWFSNLLFLGFMSSMLVLMIGIYFIFVLIFILFEVTI